MKIEKAKLSQRFVGAFRVYKKQVFVREHAMRAERRIPLELNCFTQSTQ